MRALVTGATGFIGSTLAARLIDQGHECTLLGRREPAAGALAARGAVFIQADLRESDKVINACRDADLVFHCGALAAPWGSRRAFYEVNVGGTEAVIAGCRQFRVQRLVHVSSPSILFNGRDQYDLVEETPRPGRFASHYAWSKSIGEAKVQEAQQDIDAVIIRPDAVFGPGDRILLPRIIAAARKGRLPQIGGGKNRVDITYIDNVVDALLLAGFTPNPSKRCYTVTNGEHVQVWPVIRGLLDELGLPGPKGYCPVPFALAIASLAEAAAAVTGAEPLFTRYGVQVLVRSRTYNIDAARSELGYKPAVTVAEGLRRTAAAYGALHG